jgi:hypothetical protein
MTMEDMPLTNEDKNRLRDCLSGKLDEMLTMKRTSLLLLSLLLLLLNG